MTRVLVTGACGLIGAAVVARLRVEGFQVVGSGRDVRAATRRRPDVRWVAVDFAKAKRAEDWLPHLQGVDAVVNCVGVLQGAPGNPIEGVHVQGPAALFEACERAGVRRVVHFSAIGIDRERPTPFSHTKFLADEALMRRDLDWVILRPSVVVGRAAYGGSALFRGLAALPAFAPRFAEAGSMQIVQLDDVVATVVFCLRTDAPAKTVLQLAGPDTLSLTETVLTYRRWLGLPEPRLWTVPRSLQRLAYRLGDVAGALGWRPPIRSTAGREILRGAVGDPKPWMRLTGIQPRSLAQALADEPASIQEKWFARLYLLKPLVLGGLSLFWIATGLIALGPGFGQGEQLMRGAGVEGAASHALIAAGAIVDILIGAGIAVRRTARSALRVSVGVSLIYLALATVLVPAIWLDPLGPLVKVGPVLMLTFVALAILDER